MAKTVPEFPDVRVAVGIGKCALAGDDTPSAQGLLAGLQVHPSQILHLDEFGKFLAAISDERDPQYRRAQAKMLTQSTLGCNGVNTGTAVVLPSMSAVVTLAFKLGRAKNLVIIVAPLVFPNGKIPQYVHPRLERCPSG